MTVAKHPKNQLVESNLLREYKITTPNIWNNRQIISMGLPVEKTILEVETMSDPQARIEDIEYHPDSYLDKGLMMKFSSGQYINYHHNTIFMGASVNGKAWLANTLGVQACLQL